MDRLRELKIGQTETLSRRITAEDVAAFARLSGDYNALHIDEEFAARTEFTQRVVHGFLHASLLSTLVGTKLPGRGALYVSQSIQFSRPVFIGDTVEASATVEKIDEETRLITLRTQIAKIDGTCVLSGTALVKLLRLAEERPRPAVVAPPPQGRLLQGRTALVTGASRGIGRAIARLFADQGASVWVNYHRSKAAAESLEKEILDAGGSCRLIRADVMDDVDVRQLAADIVASGALDILVHNAGPKMKSAAFTELAWTDLGSAYEEIVGSAFRVTQALLPSLKQSKGKIIAILTSAALGRTSYHWLPYVAAKSALHAMCKNLAQELGPQGVAINMISPSMVDTDLTANIPDRMRNAMISRTPLRRLATVDDVAGAALLLASPYASFITGENLLVTGGETMI
jgi:3-oxoacyl-[acyl-carrier protein] reductase